MHRKSVTECFTGYQLSNFACSSTVEVCSGTGILWHQTKKSQERTVIYIVQYARQEQAMVASLLIFGKYKQQCFCVFENTAGSMDLCPFSHRSIIEVKYLCQVISLGMWSSYHFIPKLFSEV